MDIGKLGSNRSKLRQRDATRYAHNRPIAPMHRHACRNILICHSYSECNPLDWVESRVPRCSWHHRTEVHIALP